MSLPESKSLTSKPRIQTEIGKVAGFNTFDGVFTPCLLTILGAIMFLRFGYIAGNAGMAQTLLMLLVCKFITLVTAASLSSIVSNSQVGGAACIF